MRTRVLVAVALLMLPAAQAAPATLYAHLVSNFYDFPMNTQEPDPAFAFDEGVGLATNTLTCVPQTPANGATREDYHTMYGYSSPSLVDYSVVGEGGLPRSFPERGVQADVQLDPAVPMLLHWYLSQPLPGRSSPQGAPPPMPTPNVVVQASMRVGDFISVDDRAYNEGPLIAQGRSVRATLAGELSQGVEHEVVGDYRVYHFVVPMQMQSTLIPRAGGFNVRIDTFVDNDFCSEGTVMPNSVLLHTSPGHRPRLELGVLNPVEVQAVHPQFVGDDLVVHVALLDVWGPYNLILASSNLTIQGPGLPETPLELVPERPQQYHGHGPQSLTSTWILNGTSVPPGIYTMRVSAATMQGGVSTWEGQFQLGEPALAMPGVAPAVLALGLAALATALRRRS